MTSKLSFIVYDLYDGSVSIIGGFEVAPGIYLLDDNTLCFVPSDVKPVLIKRGKKMNQGYIVLKISSSGLATNPDVLSKLGLTSFVVSGGELEPSIPSLSAIVKNVYKSVIESIKSGDKIYVKIAPVSGIGIALDPLAVAKSPLEFLTSSLSLHMSIVHDTVKSLMQAESELLKSRAMLEKAKATKTRILAGIVVILAILGMIFGIFLLTMPHAHIPVPLLPSPGGGATHLPHVPPPPPHTTTPAPVHNVTVNATKPVPP